jgi:hypothetical protein
MVLVKIPVKKMKIVRVLHTLIAKRSNVLLSVALEWICVKRQEIAEVHI